MDPAPALLMIASFLVCAALLWLAAETVAASASRPLPIGRALLAVAVLLAACGLWWPTHTLRAPEAAGALPGPSLLLPWLPAVLLAALACAVGVLWKRGLRPWAVAAAVAMPAAAYVHAMFSAPGVFRLAQTPGWLGAGTLTLGLSAALIAAQASACAM